jgi:hypothetical protein
MSIKEQYKLNINQSDDSSDHIASFHRDALYLITAGHKKLIENGTDYSNEDEPNITGELVRCTNEYIDSASSHDWTSRYDVKDESPENTKGRLGKGRKKVDIVCTLTGKKPRSRIKFEAKRLKNPSFTSSKYFGETGLGEFISGNYAPECDTAGMLGYIQSDDCDYWAEQIPDTLKKREKEVCLIKGNQWQKADFENIDYCYKTLHNRPSINRELQVFHLLLDFVMPNSN